MRNFIQLANEISAGWAAAMAGVVWQSAGLALAVGGLCWLLRRQSPGLRYLLWLALAAKMLLLPLWSVEVAAPWWRVDAGEMALLDDDAPVAGAFRQEELVPRGREFAAVGATEFASQSAAPPASTAAAWHRLPSWTTWLLAVWAAGMAIGLGRTALQFRALHRLLAGARGAEPAIEIVVEQCAARLGLARVPAVRVVEGECSPMVCGVGRATLVLPAELIGAPLPDGKRLGEGEVGALFDGERDGVEKSGIPPLTASQGATALRSVATGDRAQLLPPFEEGGRNRLRQIVLHELAHLQRRDLLTVWVIHAMRTVYWFYPVAHWVAYCAELERELDCDRLAVVNSGVSATTYAHTLIDAAGGREQPMALSAAAEARLAG